MESQRQLLRVSVKLMGLTVIVFFIYILFSGMFTSLDENKKVAATFDVSNIAAGEAGLFAFNDRKILVLHRDANMINVLSQANPQLYNNTVSQKALSKWYVAYAFDPLLGCEIKLIKTYLRFESICGGQYYDLAGRAYKNQRSQMNLVQPEYKYHAHKLMIFSN